MSENSVNPYEALEKLFHEPNRLSIMSAVCAADAGLSFNDLKEACGLTDGNLSRHLKALREAGVVIIEKTFENDKPRTTVKISRKGLDRFNEYLAALSEVLRAAKQALPAEEKKMAIPFGKTAKA